MISPFRRVVKIMKMLSSKALQCIVLSNFDNNIASSFKIHHEAHWPNVPLALNKARQKPSLSKPEVAIT